MRNILMRSLGVLLAVAGLVVLTPPLWQSNIDRPDAVGIIGMMVTVIIYTVAVLIDAITASVVKLTISLNE